MSGRQLGRIHGEDRQSLFGNLMAPTENHRKIWTEFTYRPDLRRVLDMTADLNKREVTREEEIFVNSIVFQIQNTSYAQESGLVVKLDGLRRDVSWLFSLPIARSIWEKSKSLQNEDFVEFVEACRNRE